MLLTIRDAQMRAFERSQEAALGGQIAAHLRGTQAEAIAGLTEGELAFMIAAGVARARSHGLAAPASIGLFVTLMFRIAPNFDDYPPIRAVLAERGVPPDERVELLFARVSTSQWQGAMRRADPAAWSAPVSSSAP